MAGSKVISFSNCRKSPSAWVWMVRIMPTRYWACCTLAWLVAKWLCQNTLSFSSSGCGLLRMRQSHQAASRVGAAVGGNAAGVDMNSDVAAKSALGGVPCISLLMVALGPSFTACSSWACVAPNAARRYRCPAFCSVHGFVELGVYSRHSVVMDPSPVVQEIPFVGAWGFNLFRAGSVSEV